MAGSVVADATTVHRPARSVAPSRLPTPTLELDADGQRHPSDTTARGEGRPGMGEPLDAFDQSVRFCAAGDADVVTEPAIRRGERPRSDDHPVACRKSAEGDCIRVGQTD